MSWQQQHVSLKCHRHRGLQGQFVALTVSSALSCSTPASLMAFSSRASSCSLLPPAALTLLASARATASAPGRMIWLAQRSKLCLNRARAATHPQHDVSGRQEHDMQAQYTSICDCFAQNRACLVEVLCCIVGFYHGSGCSFLLTSSAGSAARPRASTAAPASSNSFSRRFNLVAQQAQQQQQ